MCVMMAKDGFEGGIINFLLGYYVTLGCLYLTLCSLDWKLRSRPVKSAAKEDKPLQKR